MVGQSCSLLGHSVCPWPLCSSWIIYLVSAAALHSARDNNVSGLSHSEAAWVISHYCDRMFGKRNPRKGRFTLVHSWRGVRQSWQQEQEAVGHMASILRKLRGEFWSSAHFLLFIQSEIPAHATVLGTVRVILPSLQGTHCMFPWGMFPLFLWCPELTPDPCFSLSFTSLHYVFKCAANTGFPKLLSLAWYG